MRFVGLCALLAALVSSSAAFAYDDPKALVEAIYAPYQNGAAPGDLNGFYSAHLKELFAVHVERGRTDAASANDKTPAPADFNPFIDAQHALLFDLRIGEPVVLGDAALVTVSFHNFDHPSLLGLALVKEADGWKVDDVSSTGAGENWLLSWLLLYDPWAIH